MMEHNTVAERLKSAEEECDRLRSENVRLRAMLGIQDSVSKEPRRATIPVAPLSDGTVVKSSTAETKIALFRSLFRGREDVYAVRWEGRNGKAGYSPAYLKTWTTSFQRKPDVPKEYFPLTDQVIHDHLTGKLTAGVYPLLTDETCWFLAADFDKTTWQDARVINLRRSRVRII